VGWGEPAAGRAASLADVAFGPEGAEGEEGGGGGVSPLVERKTTGRRPRSRTWAQVSCEGSLQDARQREAGARRRVRAIVRLDMALGRDDGVTITTGRRARQSPAASALQKLVDVSSSLGPSAQRHSRGSDTPVACRWCPADAAGCAGGLGRLNPLAIFLHPINEKLWKPPLQPLF